MQARARGLASGMTDSRTSWEQYGTALETLLLDAPVGMALIGPDFRYVHVNRALAAAHGLTPEEHIGRSVADIVPDLWPSLEPLFHRVLAGDTVIDSDISEPASTAPGEPRRWLASYYPVHREGRVVGIGVAAHDVSALREAEDALRVRTDMYAMLSRTNRAVALCTSRDDLFRQVCEVAVDIGQFRFAWIGVPHVDTVRLVASAGDDNGYVDELRRAKLAITLDPQDRRSSGPTGQAVLRGVRSVVNDFDTSPLTGPWREAAQRAGLRASAAFPIHERGRVAAVLTLYATTPGFFTPDLVDALGEVTPALSAALDRLALEQDRAIQQADLLLRDRALHAATQGIVITDARAFDNPVIYVSPSFERLTGYASTEIVGRNCRILQGPETDPEAVAEIHRRLKAGEPCSVELLNYRRDGSTFYNSLAISPIVDATSEVTHFVGVQTDVTERRGLERRLRQAQKLEAVGQLAGGVAHDFNDILAVRGAAGPDAEALTTPAVEGSETVLYVDDSEPLRPIVARMLGGYGYTVLTAANTGDALALDAEHTGSLDLLISDSALPGLGAVALAEALRARHPEIKVLLTSASPPDEIAGHLAGDLQLDFIRKPFVAAELASKVRAVLKRR